jgi:hypothetical protein
MKIEINKEQYRRVIYKLLDILYGPEMSYEWQNDTIAIKSNDGELVFRVYTKSGRAKGCKKDMYVTSETGEEINDFIPRAATRKKLFAKTLVSYVNEKTGLDIDCIEFWITKTIKSGPEYDVKFNFNVKKNKKTKL